MANGDPAPANPNIHEFHFTVDVSGSSGQIATLVISNESGADGGPGDIDAGPIKLP
ncbi:MAG: hypothetical protein JO291_05395 [Acidimicrobiia bacterium]|nr:hypothetical protein [Acidimicrobiia bacterium]